MRLDIQLLWIGLGGALGAMARFGIAETVRRFAGSQYPLGTLFANLAGCFLIGVLLGSGHADKDDSIRLGFGVGFLGALTTFSTFGAETIKHINEGQWTIAFGNVMANVVLGLICVVVGMIAGKKFL